MSKLLLDPKQLVPAKLYTATLKFVNTKRKALGLPVLKKLPEGHPGVEGCPVGRAFSAAHRPFSINDRLDEDDHEEWMHYEGSADSDNLDDEFDTDYDLLGNQVRVSTISDKTKIRLYQRKTGEIVEIKAPKYVTQFLDAFDKKAREALV